MTFSEQLNEYMDRFSISNRALANAAGISPGTVSRYKCGKRAPDADHPIVGALAHGIALLAGDRKDAPNEQQILHALCKGIGAAVPYFLYPEKLRRLLDAAGIKGGALAKGLNFDPSYVSRILAGQRRPADPARFSEGAAQYVLRHGDREAVAALTGGDAENDAALVKKIVQFLGSGTESAARPDPMYGFLAKMDEFDLERFVRDVRFDDIKLPTLPFALPTVKHYEGLDGMKEAEIAFCRTTALSAATQDVILYSDMPMEEMAKDSGFAQKWLFGMAMMLKRGLRLHIIHNVHRPFREMILGLESHLPMYMTGQISPYYFKEKQENTFFHLLKVSGAAALSGEAIKGHHAEGRYTLSKSRADLRYYRARAEAMLKNALPLMQIYRAAQAEEFRRARAAMLREDLRITFAALPIWTLREETLMRILDRHGIEEKQRTRILDFHAAERAAVERFLTKHRLTMEIARRTAQDLREYPPYLDLSFLFREQEILCTAEEYAEHFEDTRQFAARYSNAALNIGPAPVFRNITYAVNSRCVLVSKASSPAIHFIIRHPKMVGAFRNFIPPTRER